MAIFDLEGRALTRSNACLIEIPRLLSHPTYLPTTTTNATALSGLLLKLLTTVMGLRIRLLPSENKKMVVPLMKR